MAFWDVPRRGANFFHEDVRAERFDAAAGWGFEVVRLSITELPTERETFLLGSADHYDGLVPEDLALLRRALDLAEAAGLRVVIVPLTLPGARWRQHNGGADDDRLYRDASFHAQAAAFWRDLAAAIGDHPALVGFDLLNEPRPEALGPCDARRGTPADLDGLYRELTHAIREVDPLTPIVLEPEQDGAPSGFSCLLPSTDPRVIYSFHLYEPWELVTFRRNPNVTAYGETGWHAARLQRALAPVQTWAREHRVAAARLWLSEIGIDRRIAGAGRYLEDGLGLANAAGWHWAFYAFREDDWDGMDYELGAGAIEERERPRLRVGDDAGGLRRVQPPFDAILRALR